LSCYSLIVCPTSFSLLLYFFGLDGHYTESYKPDSISLWICDFQAERKILAVESYFGLIFEWSVNPSSLALLTGYLALTLLKAILLAL